MRFGLGIGLNRLRKAAGGAPPPPAFSPADLFLASEAGFWAPVTMSRLWQDTARTAPVTATGQEVISWELSTASGVIYAEQATTGQGPLYQEDTGVGYLDFSGSKWMTIASLNLTSTDKLTLLAAVQKNSDATIGVVMEFSANPNSNAGAFSILAPGANGAANYSTSVRGTTVTGYNLTTYTAPIKNVVVANLDIAGAALATEVFPRVDGAIPTLTAIGTAAAGTGNFGSYSVFIGRRNGATLPFNGRLYGLVVRGALTSGTDLTDVEAWADALINP